VKTSQPSRVIVGGAGVGVIGVGVRVGLGVGVVAIEAGVEVSVAGAVCSGVSSSSGMLVAIIVLVSVERCSGRVGVFCGALAGSNWGRQADKSTTIPTRSAIENWVDADLRFTILLLPLSRVGY